ncbi:MAG TPA: hypothetical protein VF086_08135 [Propionibacteriaceae bacterium]
MTLQHCPGLEVGDGLHRAEDEDPGGVAQHVKPVPAGLGRDLVVGAVDGGGVRHVQDDQADPRDARPHGPAAHPPDGRVSGSLHGAGLSRL